MISLENIYLNVEASDYKEVLKKEAALLCKEGYVSEQYVVSLLRREEYSPTGLPTTPFGVALPHTDPEYVLKPCIIVLKLKKPVSFREMGNPDSCVHARYIFGLVFEEGKKQMPFLSKLMLLVGDPLSMEKLDKAQTREDILQVMQNYF